ncbi:Sestrin [Brachionus plicatilis]|uniref:Sestrin n=1 Tax=Brachionus plicatilis TaxID=10195 RepID=A0A3M7QMW9_BRAPC|nr:Sestrin [Brachionus plicatilis]
MISSPISILKKKSFDNLVILLNDQLVSQNEILSNIYSDIYAQEGVVDNLIRVISFHPEFLKEFIGFSNYLMYGQHGALSFDTRHFIAIMASARHHCIYLVKQQEKEFQSQNGKKAWIRSGLEAVPDKLKELNEINKILCHQPWRINSAHIEKILKSNWTVTELLMAVTILTHFHAMSGLVFGCGINENFVQQIEAAEEKRMKEERERKRQEEIKALIELERRRKKSKNCENEFLDEDEDDDYDQDDFDENYADEFFCFENRPVRPSRSELRSSDDFYRARSDSTGTSNRTLSNSSASSCELGIDMLLKEMQMLQNEDRRCKSLSKSSNISIGHPSKHVYASPSGLSPLVLSNSSNYLSDLSNGKLVSRHAHMCAHDANNNLPSMLLNDENLDEALDECICGESFDSSKKKIKTNSIKLGSSNSSSCTSNYISKSYTDYNEAARLNVDLPVIAKTRKLPKLSPMHEKCKLYMKKYEYEADFAYVDFDKVDQSLRLEYYTWDSQGYCTALSLYPDICEYLDKNFKIAVNMTYNTMGTKKDVDTSLFRRAVWHYVHSLYGVQYDDYDYNQIGILLKSPLRRYIKIVCSCPERITKSHYDSIMKEFTHSEKVHVNIVIMEARIQASMLYFLRAINSYFG